MPFSGEEKREYNRQYAEKEKKFREIQEQMSILDTQGLRYKSECLPLKDLYKIYTGVEHRIVDEEEEKPKPGKRKVRLPNPSKSVILGQRCDFYEWLDFRDKARKDLFWLGKDVLKKGLIEKVHQPVCDQFIQKDFDNKYHQDYTIDELHRWIDKQVRLDTKGNATKEMLLLDPRGAYKSTIDGIDCVQWMLNCPDIRILILTGEFKLALSFMTEIKGYFFLAQGGQPKDFHLLFPEYILRGRDGASKEPIDCPARLHPQKEPSLWVNAIVANLSGWHCDIRKGDDMVTDENSNTEDARLKLKEKIDGTDNLVDEWGFSDFIGTRYFPKDWYGTRLSPEEGETEVVPMKYFCRACWTVKPGFAEVPLKQLTADMVDLLFPEKLTFMSLRRKLVKNERSFRNQQLNEPMDSVDDETGFTISFSEQVLKDHSISIGAAPKDGDIYITWDTALSANKTSDFSGGVAFRVYEKPNHNFGIVVLEIIFDKWKQSELAYQIVSFNKKWNPKMTLIETLNGSELFQKEVQTLALQHQVPLSIWWKAPSSQADAKRNRIKGLETLLNNDELYFVFGPWLEETFKQLGNYTGERKNKGRKDDIPDALAYACFFLPMAVTKAADPRELQDMVKSQQEAASKKFHYDRMFGTAQNPYMTTAQGAIQAKRGPAPVQTERGDPRNAIFGGNGLRAAR